MATTITIQSGETTSNAISLGGYTLLAITGGSAAITGTAVSLYTCDTVNGTYMPMVDIDGNAIAIGRTTLYNSGPQWVALTPVLTVSGGFIKLVSDQTEAATRNFGAIIKNIIS